MGCRLHGLWRCAQSANRYRIVLPAVLLCVSGFVWLYGSPILMAIGDYLVFEDELQGADLIHVIAGPDYRTDYAVGLYLQGYARAIVFTGGWCTFCNYFHGRHGRERALRQGVPDQAIITDESSVISTYSEVLRLKEIISRNSYRIRSVLVVSDRYHMRRACWTYRNVFGPGMRVRMAPVPFEKTPYRRRWWADARSRKMVKDEYMKLVYYFARYGLGWPPLTRLLASFDRY